MRDGARALQPARLYYEKIRNSNRSYAARLVDWQETETLLSGDNRRYDIVMPVTSCGAYLANGVAVKSRTSEASAGYDHRGGFGM